MAVTEQNGSTGIAAREANLMENGGPGTASRTPDVELVEAHRLSPHPRNPRRGNVPLIRSLIRKHGFYGVIVAQKSTGYILVGRHRYQAAVEEGMDRVPVEWRDVDDAKALEMVLSDNRASDVAGYDEDELLALLKDADDLMATGWDEEAFAAMLGPPEKPASVDEVPEVPKVPVTKLGDQWRLGRHVLVCGDSRDEDTYKGLGPVDLVVTSPPYGIGKSYEESGVEAWTALMRGVLSVLPGPLWAVNLGDIKVGPDHREVHTYGLLVSLCEEFGHPLIGTRVWQKGAAWGGQGPYWLSSFRAVDEFEYLGMFGTADYKVRTREDWIYRGIWDIPSVQKNDVHPAAFPVELASRCIRLLADKGAVILDPFVGSGGTLLAAETEDRVGYGIELDPGYCDVTVERWEHLTGGKATRA